MEARFNEKLLNVVDNKNDDCGVLKNGTNNEHKIRKSISKTNGKKPQGY